MSTKRKKRDEDQDPAAATAAPPTPEQTAERLVVSFGETESNTASETAIENEIAAKRPKSFDELVAFESKLAAGAWRAWEAVKNAEVLIGSYGPVVVAEARLQRDHRIANDLAQKDPIPEPILEVFEAKARFGRAALDWRGPFFEGRPFTWENFVELWRKSLGFRTFVNGQSVFLRDRMAQEAAELGKD